MTGARRAVNWNEIRARVEDLGRLLDSQALPSAEQTQETLRLRARELAVRPEERAEPESPLDLLVFTLGGERFGIDVGHVLKAIPARGIMALPGAPPHLLGVIGHGSHAIAVMDLGGWLGLAPAAPGGGEIIVVGAAGITMGILADRVLGLEREDARALLPAPAGRGEGARRLLRGVTAGGIAALDVEALARDRRIVVNEEAV